jgi:hypothetical protein
METGGEQLENRDRTRKKELFDGGVFSWKIALSGMLDVFTSDR